jgi:hypothetical protein
MYEKEFQTFVAAYPAARRLANQRARTAFTNARRQVSFETLMSALAQQTRSEQWHKHIIPSMVTWLEDGRWIQTLPEKRKGVHARLTPFEQARRAGLK